MKDRVGTVVPSEREVAQLLEELVAIKKRLERYTVMLSGDERVAALKFRTGGESIVELIGNLAEQHQFSLPRVSIEAMRNDLTLAQRLAPVATLLTELTRRVEDTILEARSEAWWANTAYYTALSRFAVGDAQLEAALRPAVDFFATGRRAKKPAPPAPGGGGTPNTPPSQ